MAYEKMVDGTVKEIIETIKTKEEINNEIEHLQNQNVNYASLISANEAKITMLQNLVKD